MRAPIRFLCSFAVVVVLALAGRVDAQPERPPPPPAGAPAAGSAAPRPAGEVIRMQPGGGRLQPPLGQPTNPIRAEVRPAPNQAQPAAPGADVAAPIAPDKLVSNSKLMSLMFWLFALIVVGGAIFVITRKNLISAVMGMVGAFFGIAACYMMLFASFLSVIQMLVYAGAIMVLFVFVIMILNKPEDEPFAGSTGLLGKGLAGLGLAYLGYRFVTVLWSVSPTQSKVAALAPEAVKAGNASYEWGGTQAVGNNLFNDYLFPFEAVSILLLVAVVGAIAVARPIASDEGEPPADLKPEVTS